MKRISTVVLILCAGFVSVALGQQPTCGLYTPWAQFHKYNARRSNPCEKVLNAHNVDNLSLKWSYATGNTMYSSPAVANGMVYFVSYYPGYNVYALKASTGAKLWSYTTGFWVHSSPAVANGVVYVGSLDGRTYAFELRRRRTAAKGRLPTVNLKFRSTRLQLCQRRKL